MLWDTIVQFFKDWFTYPGLEAHWILISVVLAIVFGAIWLLGYWPRLFKSPGLWAVAVASAFITMLATAFVYIPLQYYYGQWLSTTFSQNALIDWMLLWTIPMVIVYGLVQEGAKMVPLVFWWLGSGRRLDVKTGITIGAVAGASFGIFEAFVFQNQLFMSGWTWDAVSSGVVVALIPFWQQFWMIAAHIAITAIVGYGLAKGKGFSYYCLASLLHAILLYISVFGSKGILTNNQVQLGLAIAATLLTFAVLLLRWRKGQGEPPVLPVEPVMPVTPEKPADTGVS